MHNHVLDNLYAPATVTLKLLWKGVISQHPLELELTALWAVMRVSLISGLAEPGFDPTTQNTHTFHHKRIRTNYASNKLPWNRHWPLRPFALLHRISEETGVEFRHIKSCSGGLLPVLNVYLKLKTNKCLHFCVQTVACMHWVQHLAPKLQTSGFPAWLSLKGIAKVAAPVPIPHY